MNLHAVPLYEGRIQFSVTFYVEVTALGTLILVNRQQFICHNIHTRIKLIELGGVKKYI